MTSEPSVPNHTMLGDRRDFSLVLGGPLFQLLRRAHLSDDALSLVHKRAIVISLICWLPLLALSAFEGQLLAETPRCRFCSTWKLTSASWWWFPFWLEPNLSYTGACFRW